ncbi:MAG TPA: MotA/TolQ/ExbB proton channel family protein [Gemmataceae bacterium]|nr:MotA/TolQ/ExbB proton channel family protein [Gemmataceae bacterium]
MHLSASQSRPMAFILSCLLALFLVTAVIPNWQRVQAADDSAQSDGAEKKEGSSGNMFVHVIKSVGIFMGIVLGILSISLVALVVLLIMDLRMGDSVPPGFVEEFTDTVNKRKFKEAYDLARQDNSFVGRVLAAGMSRLQYGIEDARETALNTVESIKAGKEQLITYLATIGTLGPLFGLVGTVYSMIGAFMKMSDKTKAVDPHEMADTLSHGLVVTMIGIAISVPAIFCHAFFRNRLVRISMDTANVADDLLTQMYHNSKKTGPTTPSPVEARSTSTVQTVKPA